MKHNKYINFILSPFTVLLIAALSVFYAVFLASGYLDTDNYFLISQGRDILTSGFPTKMQHTVLDVSTTLQQPLTDLLNYSFFKIFSFNGIYILCGLEFFTLTIVIYIYVKELTKDTAVSIILTSLLLFPCAGYLKGRPSIFSIIFAFMYLFFFRKWRITENKLYILFWSVISCLWINFHAAMWPFLFCIALSQVMYRPGKKISLYLYEAVGILLMILAGFVNPYGYKNMLYLINSRSDSSISILEMHHPALLSNFGLFIIAGIILLMFYLYKFRLKSDIPAICLSCGCLFLAMMHIRSNWFISLGSAPLLAELYNMYLKDSLTAAAATEPSENSTDAFDIKEDRLLFTCFVSLFLIGMIIISAYPYTADPKEIVYNNFATPITAADWLDKNTDIKNVRLFTDFNEGSYMRFRGYDTYFDARIEVYLPKHTLNRVNYVDEYYELSTNADFDYDKFIKGYAFSHVLAETDSLMYVYLKEHPELYRKEVSTGDYALFTVIG